MNTFVSVGALERYAGLLDGDMRQETYALETNDQLLLKSLDVLLNTGESDTIGMLSQDQRILLVTRLVEQGGFTTTWKSLNRVSGVSYS